MRPPYVTHYGFLSFAFLIATMSPEARPAVVQVSIGSFSPSTTIVDFTGPNSNPYTEAGATFSGPGLSLGAGTLIPNGALGPLSVSFPSAVDAIGFTNSSLFTVTGIQLFTDNSFANLVDTFTGPSAFTSAGAFFGIRSGEAFRSVRISTSPAITYIFDDFRFETVPEPNTDGLVALSLAALVFALVARRRIRA